MKLNPISAAASHSTRSAPTLKVALETFVMAISQERRESIYSIICRGAELRIRRRRRVAALADETIYTDLDFFIDLCIIVRQFTGNRWQPSRIAFQLWPAAGEFMKNYFPGTRFVYDKTSSWIELPQHILTLPRRTGHTSENLIQGMAGLATIEGADFVHALKQVLKTQLPDGYPEIDLAAKSMGTSVRTMQRNLTRAGLTYSKLVEFARFELAAEMLKRPNLKMIDIAYALGYQDPSHFSRAFRRFVGQTPREFRSKQLVDIEL